MTFLPAGMTFRDEAGKTVRLPGAVSRPTIIAPAYLSCKHACPLAGVVRTPLLTLPLGAVALRLFASGIGSYTGRAFPGAPSQAFRRINGFVLIVTLIIALDGILRHCRFPQRAP